MSSYPTDRPSSAPGWYKAHGLGNDYLVVEEGAAWLMSAEAVQAVCHRTRGVGGDGIVVILAGSRSPLRMRMFNPDGGEFERSGNGLRVAASYLHRAGRVDGERFEVEVGGDRLWMQVHGRRPSGLLDISVEMGRASVDPESVGLEVGNGDSPESLDLEGVGEVSIQVVSVGNPHAVMFTEELTGEELERVGPRLSSHKAFREGTNVQLARVRDSRTVDALIWERGVGRTSASGTSSCAVAVAAVHRGLIPPGEVEVRMEGGSLRVGVDADLDVVLRGPVQEVTSGELTAGFLRHLRSGP